MGKERMIVDLSLFCVCLDSYIIMLLMFLVSWMLRKDDRTSNSIQLQGKCQMGVQLKFMDIHVQNGNNSYYFA